MKISIFLFLPYLKISSFLSILIPILLNLVADSLPEFNVNQGDESLMSLDAPNSPTCATCGQKREITEYLRKIQSNQKQHLLARNRRIMGLKKENQNLRKVA